MPNVHDLQDWFGSLRESYAFLIAAPVVVGVTLACIAEWAERHLNAAEGATTRGHGASSLRQATVAQDR